jgi:L,D-transpeptidase ErfK/SrfK
VRIVNQRVKTGWKDGVLYLEVHGPLDGSDPKEARNLTALTRAVVDATAKRHVIVDWEAAEQIFNEARGEPQRISVDRWVDAPAVATRRSRAK